MHTSLSLRCSIALFCTLLGWAAITGTAAAADPDLAVTNSGATHLASGTFEFVAEISNVGGAIAPVPWDDRLEIDYQCDGSVDVTTDFAHPGTDLAPGASYTLQVEYTLTEFGDHCYTVTANPGMAAFSEPVYFANNSDAFMSVSYDDTTAPTPDPMDPPVITSFLASYVGENVWHRSVFLPLPTETIEVRWSTVGADYCHGRTVNKSGSTQRFDTNGAANGVTTISPMWGEYDGGDIYLECSNGTATTTSYMIGVFTSRDNPDFRNDVYARVNGGPVIRGEGFIETGDVFTIHWQSDDVVDSANDYCYTGHDLLHDSRSSPVFDTSANAEAMGFPSGLPGYLPEQASHASDVANAPYSSTPEYPPAGDRRDYKMGCVRYEPGHDTNTLGKSFRAVRLTHVPSTTDAPTVTLRARSNDTAPYSASDQNVADGNTLDFQWETADATRCESSDFPTNEHPFGFSTGVVPPPVGNSESYSITCYGPGGSASDSLTVTTVDAGSVLIVSPSVTFEHKVDSTGTWADASVQGARTILDNEELQLRWSTTNADTCSGTNFGAGGATSNTLTAPGAVTEPPAGDTRTYTITCTNSSGGSASESVVITTDSTVDLAVADLDMANQSTWTVTDADRRDGKWTSVRFRMNFENTDTGPVTAPQDISYGAEFDFGDDGSYGEVGGVGVVDSIQDYSLTSDLAGSAVSPTLDFLGLDVEPGTYRVRGRVDLDPDRVPEVDDSLADNSDDLVVVVPIPPPDMTLDVSRPVVRAGQTVDVDYEVDVTYALSCELVGGGISQPFVTPVAPGVETSDPLENSAEFSLTCENTTTGDVYELTTTVEVSPNLEEV